MDWNFFALFFSAALILNLIFKILFSICSTKRIGFDKWTIIDTVSAVLNIIAVQAVKTVDPTLYLKPSVKDILDYFVLCKIS